MPDRHRRVLRFEFSAALIHAVTAFVGTHRYDDRKTYKEAWLAWRLTKDTAALLDAEHARLNNLGYTGDVAVKLFKSARYYFRGKLQQQSQQQSQQPRRRQKYVPVNRTLLDAMDEHIERGITTPALGFADFCTAHAEDAVLQNEVASLFARYNIANNATNNSITITSDTQIMQEVLHKLKKTYKNRCFMQTHKPNQTAENE
jgi:hypothetical protein